MQLLALARAGETAAGSGAFALLGRARELGVD